MPLFIAPGTAPAQLEAADLLNLSTLRAAIHRLECARERAPFTVVCDVAAIGADVRQLMDAQGAIVVDGKLVWVVDAQHAAVSHRTFRCRWCKLPAPPDDLSLDGRCEACITEGRV